MAELEALAQLPEEQLDTRAMPEVRDWSKARRGVLFRPVKQQLTIRLDADLIEWFRVQAPAGEGYQTMINAALRVYVDTHERAHKAG